MIHSSVPHRTPSRVAEVPLVTVKTLFAAALRSPFEELGLKPTGTSVPPRAAQIVVPAVLSLKVSVEPAPQVKRKPIKRNFLPAAGVQIVVSAVAAVRATVLKTFACR